MQNKKNDDKLSDSARSILITQRDEQEKLDDTQEIINKINQQQRQHARRYVLTIIAIASIVCWSLAMLTYLIFEFI